MTRDRTSRTLVLLLVITVPLAVYLVGYAVSNIVPYTPYTLRGVQVTPNPVCAGGAVTGHITRGFSEEFDQFAIQESWLDTATGSEVKTKYGSLPESALTPTPVSTTQSPLLAEAPKQPGVYRIRVETQAHGTRLWIWPTVGENSFLTDTVRVKPCDGGS